MRGKIRPGSAAVSRAAVNGGGAAVSGAEWAYDSGMTVGTLMTADELLQFPDDGSRYELVRGELRKMSPTGEEHGNVSMRISISLGNYVYQHRAGRVYPADVGFRLSRDPDTVRSPDLSFVRADRVKKSRKYIEVAPDVAFEVVSPNDRYTEIAEKTLEYLRAGTHAVVIVDPQTESVRIHRSAGITDVSDILELPDLLPGWQLLLSDLFA